MSNAPLMPKATAVWLVENTSLTFEQIASFCKLHPLEVKGIADGEVAAGIKGHDPITSGQLTREEIAAAEAEERRQLQLAVPKVRLPEARRKRGARYTPLSRRQDRPNAILWLIRNHPELMCVEISSERDGGHGELPCSPPLNPNSADSGIPCPSPPYRDLVSTPPLWHFDAVGGRPPHRFLS